MDIPLINILTRTSNRPNYFKKCIDSVNKQTYTNIRHIISVDDKPSIGYVEKEECEYISIDRINKKKHNDAPYNLYLNKLNKKVIDGWVMYLDDDDEFISDESLKQIVSNIKNENQLLLWRVKFPNRLIPENIHWGKKPSITHISMIGFMYHSKYINRIEFDDQRCADYRYISTLYNMVDEVVWIDNVYTGIQRTGGMGGLGKRDDLKQNK